MIASLPMYDRPLNTVAHDRLWIGIRDNLRDLGIAAPDALDRVVLYRETWARPDLVLGQICVMPYRATFAKDVTLIAASDYGLKGCDPGFFRAYFVCRKDDPRDLKAFSNARFAANATHSFSGYEAALVHYEKLGYVLPKPLITGSHDASVLAVARSDADFACIDAQTWRMQGQDLPQTADLRVIEATAQAPGQSFITRQGDDPAPYFEAIQGAITALPQADKNVLGLRGIKSLAPEVYV